MDILEILEIAVSRNVSDILIIAGLPVSFIAEGQIVREPDGVLTPAQTQTLVQGLYNIANRPTDTLFQTGDDDFSFSVPSLARFRSNAFRQRGSLAAVVRVVSFALPDREKLGIPNNIMQFADLTKGLVLVTGPAGSGKSTTLACLIDKINSTRDAHIITIEDPIEFLHRHKMSVVSQREIATDTTSYETALRAALRQTPDVILLGEMRDYETIKAAMTAAETGHLIFSTLHTVGAADTIDRIIDIFPPAQQQQVRVQLSMVLRGVVSQQLIRGATSGAVAAFEVMTATGAIRNMIRESKAHQIDSVIFSSAAEGMISMDTSIINLIKAGKIDRAEGLRCAVNAEQMQKRLMA